MLTIVIYHAEIAFLSTYYAFRLVNYDKMTQ